MATLTQIYKPRMARLVVTHTLDDLIHIFKFRRCMLVSVGLILAGLSLPLIMALDLLPASLLIGLLAVALLATGGILTLFFCGEF